MKNRSSRNQRANKFITLEDRIIERGLTHVRILKTERDEDQIYVAEEMKEPVVDLTIKEENQAPYVIVVHGPIKVGKSTLIKSLVRYYSGPYETSVLLLGNRRRIQFVECPNNVNGMIDAAKYADAVIFLIDARYGFEMETFELLNILRVHGIPKIVGVLTFVDDIGNNHKIAEHLRGQFFAEIYEAEKLFCLSGLDQGMYHKHEIGELANFILNMEFHPSSWRAQPYVLTKYFEDVTPAQKVNRDEKCHRDIFLYGYLRGCHIKNEKKVHIAGVGDFPLFGVTRVADPFPLPADTRKRRRSQYKGRLKFECFKAGTFLRLEVHNIPFDMVKNLNPHHPILVGFVGFEEENYGYMQVSLKRHDWHRKLLKSGDPVIVSVGWRRYLTTPTYAMEGCRGLPEECLKKLDYTPKDKECRAMFWGPLALPRTSIVIAQSLSDWEAAFRILATAVVIDCNQAAEIFEKLTLIGTPCKIFKKTSLTQIMFTPGLQIDRYNKTIRTQSGVQGKIIKATKKKDDPKGLVAKCGFVHEILMSDTVRMSGWKKVEVPCVSDLLMAASKPTNRIWKHPGPYADDGVMLFDMSAFEIIEKQDETEFERYRRERRHRKLVKGKRETPELQRSVIIVEEEQDEDSKLIHSGTLN